MRPADLEYAALRATIGTRGTARLVLLPIVVLGWSALAMVMILHQAPAVAALVPLAVLVAGFESIHALHVGVERIGRYLQVFYESGSEGPQWERTALALGPGLPGGGVDPLFAAVFLLAAAFNLLLAALSDTPSGGWLLVAAAHIAFAVRIVRARRAAARQRTVELESYRALAGERRTATGA